MLERISLKGWQRHETLTIKFDPRITTITGPSESGKSAIVRALKWLCLNQWNGEAVDINHNCSVAKIKLWIDGHEITRKKGVSNLCRLDNSKFRAVGKDVPEPIANLLNVTELNFADQFDPHFWLSASAGQVSKELNAIIDLDIIDKAIARSSSEVRRAKSELEVCRKRLKEVKTQKEELAWVPQAQKQFALLSDGEARLKETQGKLSLLKELCQTVSRAKETKESLEQCVRRGREVVTLIDRYSPKADRLRTLIAQIKKQQRIKNKAIPKFNTQLRSRIEELSNIISQVKELQCLAEQKCPVCGKTL